MCTVQEDLSKRGFIDVVNVKSCHRFCDTIKLHRAKSFSIRVTEICFFLFHFCKYNFFEHFIFSISAFLLLFWRCINKSWDQVFFLFLSFLIRTYWLTDQSVGTRNLKFYMSFPRERSAKGFLKILNILNVIC